MASTVDVVAPKRPHILLATTATTAAERVTATRFADLCREVSKFAEVKAISTIPAHIFVERQALPDDIPFYSHEDQWSNCAKVGDTELHEELYQWADILVIAPLSSHSLCKIALGLCNDLVTYMVLSWDSSKPIFVAPSMNIKTAWQNSITQSHLKIIVDNHGISIIPPQIPEVGTSRDSVMAEISVICGTIIQFLLRARL